MHHSIQCPNCLHLISVTVKPKSKPAHRKVKCLTPQSYDDAVIALLSKHGNLTEGVIHNRLRVGAKSDINDALSRLVAFGKISITSKMHPRSKMEILTYWIIK